MKKFRAVIERSMNGTTICHVREVFEDMERPAHCLEVEFP